MGKFYWKLISDQQGIPYIAGTKQEGSTLLGHKIAVMAGEMTLFSKKASHKIEKHS